MFLSNEDLIKWNREGWIPGPGETEEEYFKRVKRSKDFFDDRKTIAIKLPFSLDQRIKKPLWSWPSTHLLHLFDLSPKSFVAFFRDQGIGFLQGAVTWFIEEKEQKLRIPLIQCRKALRKGTLFRMVSLDEVLAHEAIHAARVMFEDSHFEEIFAYWASFSPLRRHLGPIMRSKRNTILFSTLLIIALFFQFFSLAFPLFSLWAFFFEIGALGFFGIGLVRLVYFKRILKKVFRSLMSLLNKKKEMARAVLLRLTDEEIFLFYKMHSKEIETFIEEQRCLRWRVLRLSYFSENP